MVPPTFQKNVSTKIRKFFFKPVRPTFPKEPHSIERNQSKLQLHTKQKINSKKPQYESFKQYH